MPVIVSNFLIQLLYYVLLIVLVGFIIGILNKLFYRLLFNNQVVCYATGLIGTPIHELSHALMCLLFFHKIEEIRLYRISDDGVLGYVNHSYNKRNIYQLSGNYFIGIAPIIVGSIIIYLLTIFLLPTAGESINNAVTSFISSSTKFSSFVDLSLESIKSVFTSFSFSWMTILYVFIVLCLALHINLSNADIKNALIGLPFFIIILALVNVLFYFIPLDIYETFMGVMIKGGAYLLVTLLISLLFSIVLVIIALIIRLIVSIFKH